MHFKTKINSATSSRKDSLEKSLMEGDRVLIEHEQLHQQQSAIQNMTKFHKSMNLEIYQCIICKEARPYKAGCTFQILGGCQGQRTGVAVTTVYSSLILGGWVTKVLKNGDKN